MNFFLKHQKIILTILFIMFNAMPIAFAQTYNQKSPLNLGNNVLQQKTKFRVLLDWLPNPNQAPIWIAKYNGYYNDENLKVEIITPIDPADVPKLIATKQADVGLDYEWTLRQQIKQGLPLVTVGALIPQPLNAIMVLRDSNIHTICDLKNKRIGHSNVSSDHLVLKMMLKSCELTLKDIQLINAHYGLVTALLAHRVDAITGIMRNIEPIEIEKYHQSVRLLLPEKNDVPHYSELVMITYPHHEKDATTKQFLAATQKGLNYIVKHPKKSWEIFAQHHPECNNETMRKIWFKTIPLLGVNPR